MTEESTEKAHLSRVGQNKWTCNLKFADFVSKCSEACDGCAHLTHCMTEDSKCASLLEKLRDKEVLYLAEQDLLNRQYQEALNQGVLPEPKPTIWSLLEEDQHIEELSVSCLEA